MKETITISSPGKVILFGEHAVVYGKKAIATAVSLRTFVTIEREEKKEEERSLELNLFDLSLSCQWNSSRFDRLLSIVSSSFSLIEFDAKLGEEIANESDSLLREGNRSQSNSSLESNSSSHEWNNQKKAISALLYYYLILSEKKDGKIVHSYKIQAKSFVPVGVGMGSSAAYCVSLAAAFFKLNQRNEEERKKITLEERDPINSWAFHGERILHGTPSGVDNTVSVYGGTMSFVRGEKNVFDIIENGPKLRFLLTNTMVPRNTSVLVGGVREYYNRDKEVVTEMLDQVDSISNSCLQLFKSFGDNEEDSLQIEKLIDSNQQLLNKLGVGHQKLDEVCSISKEFGYHSKLTGAGGGGCALTYLKGENNGKINEMIEKLKGNSFQCFEIEVGANGVTIESNPL
eukprot:TRINITY_DN4551_c0_g1_i1.p1 TRINITY_DN4551_c0_g1~~TRINITY_DN4551_c0_g1_i1.p1  ORF type:complete len:402 (-),score=177.92 TRINITY_DN4551_c0_g1_i1:68-1273(-)